MNVSFRGLAVIARFEGIVLTRYRDAVGVWTIGVGHTAAAGDPDPATFKGQMSVEEAMELLEKDVAKYAADVRRAVKVPLEQHEFDALVSFHYNTGAIGKASLVRHLNAGNRARAAAGIMAYTKARGRTLSALVERRTAERAMFEAGTYPPAKATLYPATPAGTVQWNQAKTISLDGDPPIDLPARKQVEIIAMGTNDFDWVATAKANIDRAVGNALARGRKPVVVLPNAGNPKIAAVAAAVEAAATQAGAIIERPLKWSPDKLHPTAAEYRRIAAGWPGAIVRGDSFAVGIIAAQSVKSPLSWGEVGASSQRVIAAIEKIDGAILRPADADDEPEAPKPAPTPPNAPAPKRGWLAAIIAAIGRLFSR